jgi:hypothetical protein
MAIGASEIETFWTAFPRSLARRGLRGVKLVISDAHEGPRRRSPRCSTHPDSAAARISCAMCRPMPASRGVASSPPLSPPRLPRRTPNCAEPVAPEPTPATAGVADQIRPKAALGAGEPAALGETEVDVQPLGRGVELALCHHPWRLDVQRHSKQVGVTHRSTSSQSGFVTSHHRSGGRRPRTRGIFNAR